MKSALKHQIFAHLAPAGPTYIEELDAAGGVYAVLNELDKKGLIYTDVMTCTGKTLKENLVGHVNKKKLRK